MIVLHRPPTLLGIQPLADERPQDDPLATCESCGVQGRRRVIVLNNQQWLVCPGCAYVLGGGKQPTREVREQQRRPFTCDTCKRKFIQLGGGRVRHRCNDCSDAMAKRSPYTFACRLCGGESTQNTRGRLRSLCDECDRNTRLRSARGVIPA